MLQFIFKGYQILLFRFMSPSNHPYKFPAVDMDKSPVVILNSIGPVLHSVPLIPKHLRSPYFHL